METTNNQSSMENNPYIKAVENLLEEGKVVIVAELTPYPNNKGSLINTKIFAQYEQAKIIRSLVNKEINKIPKWIKKLFKINTLHLK